MMKSRVLLMVGLWLGCMLTACEEEITVPDNQITVEQFAPVQKGNKYVFSGRVHFPKGLDREVVKVGFWISERNEYDYGNYENAIDAFMDIPDPESLYQYHYERWLTGDTEDSWGDSYPDYWVEEIAADGSFTLELSLKPNQYMCKAFAMNIVELDVYDDLNYYYCDKIQVAQSKPFYISGNVSEVSLQLDNMLNNSFLVTVADDNNVHKIGICWSTTQTVPNVGDNLMDSHLWDGGKSYFSMSFDDEDVVYLRAYVLYYIQDAYSSEGESYRIVYSDVLEYHPKEQVFEINNKADLQQWGLLTEDYRESYFRGTVLLNYVPTVADWMDKEGNLIGLQKINCTVKGRGVVFCDEIGEKGYLEGVTLKTRNWGITNEGTLKNVQTLDIGTNYGQIIDSDSIGVEYNRGTVQNCTRVKVNHNYGIVQNCRNSLEQELTYNDGNFEEGIFTDYTGSWWGYPMYEISGYGEGYNSHFSLTFTNIEYSYHTYCEYNLNEPLPAGEYTFSFAVRSDSIRTIEVRMGNNSVSLNSIDYGTSPDWTLYETVLNLPVEIDQISFFSNDVGIYWIDNIQLGDAFNYYSSTYMVENNNSFGQIIGCSIEDSGGKYICNTNSGMIKDCTPIERVCATNYGIIQDSSK